MSHQRGDPHTSQEFAAQGGPFANQTGQIQAAKKCGAGVDALRPVIWSTCGRLSQPGMAVAVA